MSHVAICFSDPSGTYYKHALVTGASLFANAYGNLTLHVVHDDTITREAKEKFLTLPRKEGQSVLFYNAQAIPEDVEKKIPKSFSRGALFRLMLPDLIAEKKLLYLDCDVVCECDPAEALQQELKGAFLGVVPFGKERIPYFVKRLKLLPERYFNSGVMLMNLERFRQERPRFIFEIFDIIQAQNKKLADQEALNILFNKCPDALVFLPERFNFRTWPRDHAALSLAEYKGKIIHFSGEKPWTNFSNAAVHYWKYYTRLFPEEDNYANIISLEPFQYAYLCSYMLRVRFIRRIVRRCYEIQHQGLFHTLLQKLFQGSGESRPSDRI